ncbi:hypothetical protein [Streptomyces sp. NPDC055036]
MNTYTRSQVITAIDTGVRITAEADSRDTHEKRFVWTRAAMLVFLDNPSATSADVKARYERLDAEADSEGQVEANDSRTYSLDQVLDAVSRGAEEAAKGYRGRHVDDLDDFAVNAVMTRLDSPAADFTDIVDRSYGETPGIVSMWLSEASSTEKLLLTLNW